MATTPLQSLAKARLAILSLVGLFDPWFFDSHKNLVLVLVLFLVLVVVLVHLFLREDIILLTASTTVWCPSDLSIDANLSSFAFCLAHREASYRLTQRLKDS